MNPYRENKKNGVPAFDSQGRWLVINYGKRGRSKLRAKHITAFKVTKNIIYIWMGGDHVPFSFELDNVNLLDYEDELHEAIEEAISAENQAC